MSDEAKVCYICDNLRTKRRLSDGTPVCKGCQDQHLQVEEKTEVKKEVKAATVPKKKAPAGKKAAPVNKTQEDIEIDDDWRSYLDGFNGFGSLVDPD